VPLRSSAVASVTKGVTAARSLPLRVIAMLYPLILGARRANPTRPPVCLLG
jgi:hypothetical protein